MSHRTSQPPCPGGSAPPPAPKANRLTRLVRYQWLRLVRLKGDPLVLSRGVAVGVFVGLTPTIPFHTVAICTLCILLRGHILAGIAASFFVSNPVSIPFIYYASWLIGRLMTDAPPSWAQVETILHDAHRAGIFGVFQVLSVEAVRTLGLMTLGSLVFALPTGVASYFLAVYLYFQRQRRRLARFANRKNDRSIPENSTR